PGGEEVRDLFRRVAIDLFTEVWINEQFAETQRLIALLLCRTKTLRSLQHSHAAESWLALVAGINLQRRCADAHVARRGIMRNQLHVVFPRTQLCFSIKKDVAFFRRFQILNRSIQSVVLAQFLNDLIRLIAHESHNREISAVSLVITAR